MYPVPSTHNHYTIESTITCKDIFTPERVFSTGNEFSFYVDLPPDGEVGVFTRYGCPVSLNIPFGTTTLCIREQRVVVSERIREGHMLRVLERSSTVVHELCGTGNTVLYLLFKSGIKPEVRRGNWLWRDYKSEWWVILDLQTKAFSIGNDNNVLQDMLASLL